MTIFWIPTTEKPCCRTGKVSGNRFADALQVTDELDFTYRFENGYCCVLPVDAEIADDWIVIDRQGTAIPMPENCYAAGPISDGLVPVWDSETELYGYMDLSGNIVIEPQYDARIEQLRQVIPQPT